MNKKKDKIEYSSDLSYNAKEIDEHSFTRFVQDYMVQNKQVSFKFMIKNNLIGYQFDDGIKENALPLVEKGDLLLEAATE